MPRQLLVQGADGRWVLPTCTEEPPALQEEALQEGALQEEALQEEATAASQDASKEAPASSSHEAAQVPALVGEAARKVKHGHNKLVPQLETEHDPQLFDVPYFSPVSGSEQASKEEDPTEEAAAEEAPKEEAHQAEAPKEEAAAEGSAASPPGIPQEDEASEEALPIVPTRFQVGELYLCVGVQGDGAVFQHVPLQGQPPCIWCREAH